MKNVKSLFALLFVFIISSCTIVIENNSSSNEDELSSSSSSYSSIEESTTSDNIVSSSDFSSEPISESSTEEISSSEDSSSAIEDEYLETDPLNEEAFRFSSIYDKADKIGKYVYKMKVPYNDSYNVKCSTANNLKLFDNNKKLICDTAGGIRKFDVNLKKDDIVYLEIDMQKIADFNLIVTATDHLIELPYEINCNVDPDSFALTNNGNSPLKDAPIKYTKRSDDRGLYINSNNPEALTTADLNKSFTREDVSGKDVFFTFEHNSINSTKYYYGYRVTNTGNSDIFVTVKNIGYQISGAGAWLGEDEWIKFYNIPFESLNQNTLTASQKANYNAYVAFARNYQSNNYKPVTYRIPAGEYIYTMGGTTADCYNNINVAYTADKYVTAGCANGAVLFEVRNGSAEGNFLLYNNADTVNASDYVTGNNMQGYVVSRNGNEYGSQYIGHDDCHGVVDADITWVFNDKTNACNLPVTYENPYYVNGSYRTGTPYTTISKYTTQYMTGKTSWNTHINPNNTSNAVGTDMTFYKTIDNATGKEICIDYMHYDGRGKIVNIGNWMVDYIDNITLVNQGDKTRTFTYKLVQSGVLLAFVRDKDGFISDTYTPKYAMRQGTSNYGDGFEDLFIYTVNVAPHSVLQFSVDYNLLANSYGNVVHSASLQ